MFTILCRWKRGDAGLAGNVGALKKVKSNVESSGVLSEYQLANIQEATNTIDKAGTRSRAIERQLRQVQCYLHITN